MCFLAASAEYSVDWSLGWGTALLVLALWPFYRRAAWPTRAAVHFGVTVPAGWPRTAEGRTVEAAYRRRVAAGSVAGLSLSVAGGVVAVTSMSSVSPAVAVLAATAGPIVQGLAATAAYVAGRRVALPRSVPDDEVRQASLEPDRYPTVGRWVAAQVGPVAVLAVSAVLLATCWSQVPARFPTRFDAAGHPTVWVDRSVPAVFWPAVVGGLTCGFTFVFGLVTTRSGRRVRDAGRDDRYLTAVLRLTLVGEYVAVVILSAAGWLPVLYRFGRERVVVDVAFATVPVLAGGLFYFATRVWPGLRRAVAGGGDGTPDRCWRWGLVYVNPADPAVLVPKRFGFGYTLNLARGETWVLVAGMVAYVAAVVAVPLAVGRR